MGKKGKKQKKEERRRGSPPAAEAAAADRATRLAERSLCKWADGEVEEHLAVLADLVSRPRYVCRRCARAARRKRNLCKPVALPVE